MSMTPADSIKPLDVRRAGQLMAKVYPNRQMLGQAAGLDMAGRLHLLLGFQQRVTIVSLILQPHFDDSAVPSLIPSPSPKGRGEPRRSIRGLVSPFAQWAKGAGG
jgi:hypothetical protein